MEIASRDQRADHLERLHISAIRGSDEIRSLLADARSEKAILLRGLNRQADRETARILEVGKEGMVLATTNFDDSEDLGIWFTFVLGDRSYAFETRILQREAGGRMSLALPTAVHIAERREGGRQILDRLQGRSRRVRLSSSGREIAEGEVIDESPSGLGVRVDADSARDARGWMRLRFVDGDRAGSEYHAEVRHARPVDGSGSWVRLGLRVSSVASGDPVEVERFDSTSPSARLQRARGQFRIAAAIARQSSRTMLARLARRRVRRPTIPIFDYPNDRGEVIRAIIDSVGDPVGAPAIIMPPAWGKTKETLLPLAQVILETFRKANQPVVVVRYDGIRRRGESYNEPDCRTPGREFLKFTVSQALSDIQTTVDFLERSPLFQPRTAILVTFSASAIEGRRALALEERGRIGGWVSVVGASDLRFAMKVLSGGIDYYSALEKGLRFGPQEVLGTVMDIDLSGLDAMKHGFSTLEDSRRDMARITAPITWLHGRYDAWMDLGRVRDMLSCGDTSARRLIELPTGHQLKSSRQALETFQLIASEVSRMAIGKQLAPAIPDPGLLEQRRLAERARIPRSAPDVRSLWRDYLVGRDGQLGIEMLTAASSYASLMEAQIRGLRLTPGDRVLDLGAGTGSFTTFIARRAGTFPGLQVHQLDYVREGLQRAQKRLAEGAPNNTLRVHRILADLDTPETKRSLPVSGGCYDAALASLLLSYLQYPSEFLREVWRVLKPGGRLVVSTLRRDADISKLYLDGLAEMPPERIAATFGEAATEDLAQRSRNFLNESARILDLEEQGYFRFWDSGELGFLVRQAGFSEIRTDLALGDPPQAVVLTAIKA